MGCGSAQVLTNLGACAEALQPGHDGHGQIPDSKELAHLQASCVEMLHEKQDGSGHFFLFFWLGYREDVHSMQAARPTKIPDEPMLCETPALSR